VAPLKTVVQLKTKKRRPEKGLPKEESIEKKKSDTEETSIINFFKRGEQKLGQTNK